jgi:hypothetical protein
MPGQRVLSSLRRPSDAVLSRPDRGERRISDCFSLTAPLGVVVLVRNGCAEPFPYDSLDGLGHGLSIDSHQDSILAAAADVSRYTDRGPFAWLHWPHAAARLSIAFGPPVDAATT